MDQQVLEYSLGKRDERSARRARTWSVVSIACAAVAAGLYVSSFFAWREPMAVSSLPFLLAAVVAGIMSCYYAPRTRIARAALVAAALCAFAIGGHAFSPVGHSPGHSHQARCKSHLRAIGQCILLYSNDNGGAYPPTLGTLMVAADLGPEFVLCPAADETAAPGTQPADSAKAVDANPMKYSSYVYLGARLNARSPANCVIAYERRHTHHEDRGMNVLYNDGSVQWVDEKAAKHIEGELAAGYNPPRRPEGEP